MLATTTATIRYLSHIPVDWFIAFAVFALAAFDGYRSGAARASAAAIALPLAVFLANMAYSTFALGAALAALHASAYPAAIIGILFVALFLIIGRMVEPAFGAGGIISALLGGAGGMAVVLPLLAATPALAALFHFSVALQSVFGDAYRLYWIIGGYVALAFARG